MAGIQSFTRLDTGAPRDSSNLEPECFAILKRQRPLPLTPPKLFGVFGSKDTTGCCATPFRVRYATVLAFFGHAVGETNLDLQALIASAVVFAGPGIIVPTRNSGLFRWCLENGLRVVQPMTLMSSGLYNEPAGAYLPSVLF